MSRSVGLAHIIRQADGSATGVWGFHTLQTAFQPIFLFCEGRVEIIAYEGLIRPSRDGNPVKPPVFFNSLAEDSRFEVETLTRTLHLLNAGRFLDPKVRVFVNFDPSLFSDTKAVNEALRHMRLVLHEAGIDAGRIVCEVTEQKSQSEEALRDFVAALRGQGYRIAVDDYGAADSDIARIKELRPDIVKFDAQWITHLMESGPGFDLLSAMVEEFAAKGIQTVFEGIEEGWQLDLAERSGASMVQGFVLARPQTVPGNFAWRSIPQDRDESAMMEPELKDTPEPEPCKQAQRGFGRRVR